MTDVATQPVWLFVYRYTRHGGFAVRCDRDEAEIEHSRRVCVDLGAHVGAIVRCELPTPDDPSPSRWTAAAQAGSVPVYVHTFRFPKGSIWAIACSTPNQARIMRQRQQQGGYAVGPGRVIHAPDIT